MPLNFKIVNLCYRLKDEVHPLERIDVTYTDYLKSIGGKVFFRRQWICNTKSGNKLLVIRHFKSVHAIEIRLTELGNKMQLIKLFHCIFQERNVVVYMSFFIYIQTVRLAHKLK